MAKYVKKEKINSIFDMVKIPSSPLPSPFVYSVFLLYCVVLESSRLPFLFKDSCEKAERERRSFGKRKKG